MGIYYDDRVYGIKWDLIVETPVYKHNTVFGLSQNKPIEDDADMLEEIRAEFFKLTEEEKEKYRFYFYKYGTSTYDGQTDTFYTWMPCGVFEVIELLCRDMRGDIP